MSAGPDISRSRTDSAVRNRRAAEQRARLFEALRGHAIFMLDPAGVIQPWDVGEERVEGFSSGPLVGHHFSVLYPPAQVRAGKPAHDLELAADLGTFEEESWRVRRDGRRFWAHVVTNALRGDDGRLVGFIQVTADLSERQARKDLERELVREKAVRAEAEAAASRMRTLLEASRLLSAHLDPEQGVVQLARLLVPEVADWCAVHLVDPDGSVHRVDLVHRDPGRVRRAEHAEAGHSSDPDAPVGVHEVLRTGQSLLLLPRVEQELLARFATDEAHRALIGELGLESAIIVPLLARGYAVGTLTLVAAQSGRRYGATDLLWAEDLAARAALALDNARLYTEARAELEARESAEAELRSAHARMEVILQGVSSGITVQDAAGRLVYANDAAARMVGYGSGRELQEAPIVDVLARLDIMDRSGAPLPRSELPGRKRPRDEDVEERILRYRVKETGAEYWSRVRSKAILAESGDEVLSINIFHDITERMHVERARREEARIVDALHRIGQSLAQQLDRDAIVKEVTDTAAALTGAEVGAFVYDLEAAEEASYQHHAVAGVPQGGVFMRRPVPRDIRVFTAVLDERRTMRIEDLARGSCRAEVERFHAASSEPPSIRSYLAVPVLSRTSDMIGALCLGHGKTGVFTERHERLAMGVAGWASVALDNARLYEEEHLARTTAEKANRVKAAFLATISHELRTPLNAMIGYTDLLLQGIPEPISQGPKERVERIGASARHLRELIEELLTFSRLDAGQEQADIQPVDLSSLLEDVEAFVEPLTLDRGLRLDVQAPESPIEIESDARRLRQILLNLVGNAIKFTAEGDVAVSVERLRDEVLLHVSDTGPGIDPSELERVFEPFYRIDRAGTRPVPGTGLGLTVTRRLAHLLGGEITVRSDVGLGSTFTLRVPVNPPRGVRSASPETRGPGPSPGDADRP